MYCGGSGLSERVSYQLLKVTTVPVHAQQSVERLLCALEQLHPASSNRIISSEIRDQRHANVRGLVREAIRRWDAPGNYPAATILLAVTNTSKNRQVRRESRGEIPLRDRQSNFRRSKRTTQPPPATGEDSHNTSSGAAAGKRSRRMRGSNTTTHARTRARST